MYRLDGNSFENLHKLRFNIYKRKLAPLKKVPLSQLPPTEVASAQHSLRVYLRIHTWLGTDLNPVDFGWPHDNEAKLVPVMLEKAPVPRYLYPQ